MAGCSKLVWGKIFKSGTDASSGGDSDKFKLHTTTPSHSWKISLQQQVIGLIVKAPLTDYKVGSSVLAHGYLVHKIFLLEFVQFHVLLGTCDIQLSLVLRLG